MADAKPGKNADLPVRVASAVVMVLVAGTALWLGGWFWATFVLAVALGVMWEWVRLSFAISSGVAGRVAWSVAGLLYIGLAAVTLMALRAPYDGIFGVGQILFAVIGVDIGAYFAGRAIGGPKIAPSISPSKTWAGLLGGAVGGSMLLFAISWAWPAGLCEVYIKYLESDDPPLPPGVLFLDDRCHVPGADWSVAWQFLIAGSIVAVIAQAGDFFESWMKRKAGVKDSSNLIPGHGGLFDRTDGLIAVCSVGSIVPFVARLFVP